jgi:hypothetical protein
MPVRPELSSFRIISERNIFNGSRSSRAARKTGENAAPPVVLESFSLVGTMSFGKGTFAVFNSKQAEHRKVLKAGDTIAGHRIASIQPDRVNLEANGRCTELKVGRQFTRGEDGTWETTARSDDKPVAGPASPASSAPAAEAAGSTPAPAAASSDDEVLKKMLQKREEEMTK